MGSRLLSASPGAFREAPGLLFVAAWWCPPVGARVLGIGCVLEVAGFRVIVAASSGMSPLPDLVAVRYPFVAKKPFPVAGLRSLVALPLCRRSTACCRLIRASVATPSRLSPHPIPYVAGVVVCRLRGWLSPMTRPIARRGDYAPATMIGSLDRCPALAYPLSIRLRGGRREWRPSTGVCAVVDPL